MSPAEQAALIKRIRNRPHYLTLTSIADATGLKPAWLQQLNTGKHGRLNIVMLRCLRDYLDSLHKQV